MKYLKNMLISHKFPLINKLIKSNRTKIFIKSFSYSLLARGIGVINLIVITPLTLNYFGTVKFAVWTLIFSVVRTMGFADLGLGNGLLNYLIINKNKDTQIINKTINSTFAVLSTLSLILILFLLILYKVGLLGLIKINYSTNEEVSPFIIACILFLLNIPLQLIQKIQYSNLHNDIYHKWEAISKLLTIIALYILIKLRFSFNAIVFTFFLIPIITNLANSAIYFLYKNKSYTRTGINFKLVQPIIKIGILFFITGILHIIVNSGDNFLISYFTGLELLTYYQVSIKPFELLGTVIIVVSGILWPFFGNAKLNNNKEWINKTVLTGIYSIILFSILSYSSLALIYNKVINFWFHYEEHYNLNYILTISIFMTTFYVGVFLSAVLNGLNMVRELIYVFLVYIIISTPLKIFALINANFVLFHSFNAASTIIAKNIYPYLLYRKKYLVIK